MQHKAGLDLHGAALHPKEKVLNTNWPGENFYRAITGPVNKLSVFSGVCN